jgi:glucokinase
MSEIFIGIDLGGTNIKIGCFDSQIKLVCKTAAATGADMGPEAVVDRIGQTTEKLLADNGLSSEVVGAVGIGAPGPAKLDEGIIIASPNMPGRQSWKTMPTPPAGANTFSARARMLRIWSFSLSAQE